MPLIDLYEDAHNFGEYVGFRMADGERRIVVHVSREAVDDTPPGGAFSMEKFEENRGLYGAVASDKYDRGDLSSQEPPVVKVFSADVS